MDQTKKTLLIEPSPNYDLGIGILLWMLEDARHRTKQSIKGIDDQMLNLSSGSDGNSIGSMLYHIAAIEVSWLYTEILESKFPDEIIELFPYNVRDENGQLSDVKGESIAEHMHRLDVAREYLMNSLQGMSIDEFRRIREFDDYDVSAEWVIHHLIQHETEHRGQIIEILGLAKD